MQTDSAEHIGAMDSAKDASPRSAKKRPCVVDVARLAGVDHSTVSRFLNNRPNIAPETQERIRRAIDMVGYKPSVSGRALALQRSETVGLIQLLEHEYDNYGGGLIHGVSMALGERNLRLAVDLFDWRKPGAMIGDLQMFRTHCVDGVLLDVGEVKGSVDSVLSHMTMPYVWVNPTTPMSHNAVLCDDELTGFLATEHVIKHGHRRISFSDMITEYRHGSREERIRGYQKAMLAHGLVPIPTGTIDATLHGSYFGDGNVFDRLVSDLVQKDQCTAIVCYNAHEAVRIHQSLRERGVRVPQDISLVACDWDPIVLYCQVPIEGMHLDRQEIGRKAVGMLVERMANPTIDIPSIWHRPVLKVDCIPTVIPLSESSAGRQ